MSQQDSDRWRSQTPGAAAPSQGTADQARHLARAQWRRRSIVALILSRVVTAMAVGIYFVGVVIYFSNFNFGSGGDRRGAVLVFVAIFLGLLAVVSDLWAILAAGMTWKNSGSAGWLALALVLPLLEILATALVVRNL